MLPKWFYCQAACGGDLASAEPYWSNPHYVAQEKLDGARYIIHKDEKGNVKIYSRRISKQTGEPVVKTAQLQHLANEFTMLVPDGTVLDGEVVAHGLSTFNLVTRVTGSKPERALEVQGQHGFLEFRAFDCLAYDGQSLTDFPYSQRAFYLKLLPPSSMPKNNRYLYRLLTAEGEEAKRHLYEAVVAMGGEGIILKDVTAPYHQGDRHKSWVKVKRQRTFDVVFMGIQMAEETSVKKGATAATTTRIAGQAGAIKYGMYVVKPAYTMGLLEVPESRELTALGTVAGFDDSVRADITENYESYIGRVLEVEAQGQFASGALQNPRFKQWRYDKNTDDCVFRKDEG